MSNEVPTTMEMMQLLTQMSNNMNNVNNNMNKINDKIESLQAESIVTREE
jgi:hypothetical protein